MNRKSQKIILFTCLLLLVVLNSRAQKNRFIYIQAENKQPFYVKVGERLFSSSEGGYLIIPKLAEGTYELSVGFPKSDLPLQNVTCKIEEADVGYLLKKYGDKGWGLVDLGTMQVIMAREELALSPAFSSGIAADSFSLVLASVVNDRGILKTQTVEKDTQSLTGNDKRAEAKPPVIEDEMVTLADQKKDSASVSKPGVKKLKEENTARGINIIFLDVSYDKADTVVIFIPMANDNVADSVAKKSPDPKIEQKKEKTQSRDSKFLDMEFPNPNLRKDTATLLTDSIAVAGGKTGSQNMPCKKTAANSDFLDLRKLMATALNENDMINAALKKFRLTCFTTEQVKNLGDLFPGDEGKYKLYVAAYPFISDLSEFKLLESQLKEDYYISRFKAMLRQ